MEFVTSFTEKNDFSTEQTNKIALSLEEAIVNICNYAYPDLSEGDIEVSCSLAEENLIIKILDNGIPFDIVAHADPDISEDISERRIGGLGILLIKKMENYIFQEKQFIREPE